MFNKISICIVTAILLLYGAYHVYKLYLIKLSRLNKNKRVYENIYKKLLIEQPELKEKPMQDVIENI